MLQDLIRIAIENNEDGIKDSLIDAIKSILDFDSIAENIVLKHECEIELIAQECIVDLFDLPPF